MNTSSSRALRLGALLGILFVPAFALAAEFRMGDSPEHAQGETVSDDLYMIGGSITSSGIVRGDLITIGGNVLINGAVTGDIAGGAGNITVLSDVGDDVRISGGTIELQGAVAGDVLIGGGQVKVSSSRVGGDVTIGGGMVRLDAPVTGDVRIGGGDVRINSAIGGNVEIQAENIVLGPKAVIEGTLTYTSPNQVKVESGAIVRGETVFTKSPDVREAAKLGIVAFFSVWFVAKLFMVFSGALVVGYVFQRYSAELVALTMAKSLANIARGVVFMIVVPIVSILLLFTIIGIGFGILGLLAYIASWIFAAMVTPLVIGSVVHKLVFKQAEYEVNIKTILTGTVLFFLVGVVPVLGGIVISAAMLTVLGAALSIKGKILSEWR